MGIYINRGNYDFSQALNSTFVDKSGLISIINRTLFTEQRRSCTPALLKLLPNKLHYKFYSHIYCYVFSYS